MKLQAHIAAKNSIVLNPYICSAKIRKSLPRHYLCVNTNEQMALKVYKSAAGSGKTFTLVKEYLVALFQSEQPSNYRHILALTFTNKAAAEMKERIIDSLYAFSHPEAKQNTDLMALIIKEVPRMNEEALRKQSARILEEILIHYYHFSVSTIDKFNQKIIRSFSTDLNLGQNFEITTDVEPLLREAIELLLTKSVEDEELTAHIKNFIVHQIEQDKSWNIAQILFDFSKTILNEESIPFLKILNDIQLEDISRVIAAYKEFISKMDNFCQSQGKKAIALLDQQGITNEFFKGKSRGLGSYFIKLYNPNSGATVPSDAIQNNVSNDDWLAAKLTPEQQNQITLIESELIEIYHAVIEYQQQHLDRYKVMQVLLKNIHSLILLKYVASSFEEVKSKNNLLPISDFNHLISSLVAEEPSPFIYERIGNRYKHFLIDEFQDTSRLQWQNLVPLFEDSLSKGGASLLVGDGKQAIYRWRGGDVNQLINPFSASTNTLLDSRLKYLDSQHVDFKLDTNYRSFGEVVKFNNELFTEISTLKSGLIHSVFHDCAQHVIRQPNDGYVRFEMMNSDEHECDLESWNKWKVEEAIDELIHANFSYEDIAILGRSNKQITSIAEHLLEKNIPIVTQEALLVLRDPTTKLLHSLLLLGNDSGNIPLRVKIIFLIREIEGDTDDIHQVLKDIIDPQHGIQALEFYLRNFGFDIQFHLLNEKFLIEKLRYLLSGLNISKPNPFLEAYLNVIHEQNSTGNKNLKAILEFVEEKKHKLSIALPEGPNAVRLLTIHKSKGLEFPAVIMPFAGSRYRHDGQSWTTLDVDKYEIPVARVYTNSHLVGTELESLHTIAKENQELDELNTLYVGFTRAIESLVVLSESKPTNNNSIKMVELALRNLSGWDEDGRIFTRGILSKSKKEVVSNENSSYTPKKFYINPTADRIKLQRLDLKEASGEMNERTYGILLHQVLSEISDHHKMDSIQNKINLLSGIDTETKTRLLNDVTGVMTHSTMAKLFDPNCDIRTEANLVNMEGEILRPDMVIIGPEKVSVIDYKTGKKDNKNMDQVVQYKSVLKSIGYQNVEGYLFYTQEQELIEV